MTALLTVDGLGKSFTFHLHEGAVLPVVSGVRFDVDPGDCVVLGGPSGAGKSSLMRMIYGNYRCDRGAILLRDGNDVVDLATADARTIVDMRRRVVGYVSQFLRVIPRVAALDVVAEPAIAQGLPRSEATARAAELMRRLNLPERLWSLPPATFSGGEQQRVNIARGFVADHSLLLLDEPTASLDAANRDAVLWLVAEKRERGTGVVAIFHDEEVRRRVDGRIVDIAEFAAAS